MGCEPNIIKIFNEFKKRVNGYEKAITFIDFKGAYNRVNHKLLFRDLKEKVRT